MTTRPHLTVIAGGKENRESRYPNFIQCEATDTRLMGVVGVRAIEEAPDGSRTAHFFHLDFEEFGIDAYERLEQPHPEDVELLTARIMGGLGGTLRTVQAEGLAWLIREAYRLNLREQEDLPEGMEGLFGFLRAESQVDKHGIQQLWQTITPTLETDPELIHYYMMRLGARDLDAVAYLSRTGHVAPELSQPHGVLVRNRVQSLREAGGIRYWQSEALLDTDREYWMLACEIGVFEENGQRRIFSASVQSQFRVSEYEASFILRRPEYLAVYEVTDNDRLRLYLDLHKPGALVNNHEAGVLYTWFKPDNRHVQDPMYFINNDVQVFYYVTEDGQLVVCTLEPQLLEDTRKELGESDMKLWTRFERTYRSDVPILYDFVQSDYLDFHEFWEDAQE